MSLICTMVKPSSAGGRPGIGTSTSTTAAVRRALRKPHAVIAAASNGTARPLSVARRASGKVPGMATFTRALPSSAASRSRVSTNSDEKSPRPISPAQVSAAASRRERTRDARSDSGISVTDASSVAAIRTATGGISSHGGTSRQPRYRCSATDRTVRDMGRSGEAGNPADESALLAHQALAPEVARLLERRRRRRKRPRLAREAQPGAGVVMRAGQRLVVAHLLEPGVHLAVFGRMVGPGPGEADEGGEAFLTARLAR